MDIRRFAAYAGYMAKEAEVTDQFTRAAIERVPKVEKPEMSLSKGVHPKQNPFNVSAGGVKTAQGLAMKAHGGNASAANARLASHFDVKSLVDVLKKAMKVV